MQRIRHSGALLATILATAVAVAPARRAMHTRALRISGGANATSLAPEAKAGLLDGGGGGSLTTRLFGVIRKTVRMTLRLLGFGKDEEEMRSCASNEEESSSEKASQPGTRLARAASGAAHFARADRLRRKSARRLQGERRQELERLDRHDDGRGRYYFRWRKVQAAREFPRGLPDVAALVLFPGADAAAPARLHERRHLPQSPRQRLAADDHRGAALLIHPLDALVREDEGASRRTTRSTPRPRRASRRRAGCTTTMALGNVVTEKSFKVDDAGAS